VLSSWLSGPQETEEICVKVCDQKFKNSPRRDSLEKSWASRSPIFSDQCKPAILWNFYPELHSAEDTRYIFDISFGFGIFCPLIVVFCISCSSMEVHHMAYIFSCMP